MYKTVSLFFIIVCCTLTQSKAQNKYAVIIGINEYYDQPGVLSSHSLKGCVNDAMCVQALLLSRFRFPKENIYLLLNADATRKNMTDALQTILEKGKAGDAVVFYFCGHGLYFINPALDHDTVKNGYNQSICMSNLYAPDYDCLVKDNTLKKLFNKFVQKQMIATALFDCCFSGDLILPPNPFHHNHYCSPGGPNFQGMKSLRFEDIPSNRSFDISKTLTIIDTEKIPRPSETKNSKFASLSASQYNEIAREIYDESDHPHGAFTKALLLVYERSRVDLPLSLVLKQISDELNNNQMYEQKATYHYDPARIKSNLIGLPLQGALPAFKATCLSNNGANITINAGYHSGLAAGNIFGAKTNAGNVQFTLSEVWADSSVATVSKPSSLRPGDEVRLVDAYTLSSPLLKIYVPVMNLSSEKFAALFAETFLPLTKQKQYMDFHNWWDDSVSYNYVFANQEDAQWFDSIRSQQSRFFLYFSLPSDIGNFIKKELQKDQNLQLVNSPEEADKVLRLNYSPVSADNKEAGFVFTYNTPVGLVNAPGYTAFCYRYTQVASLLLPKASSYELSRKIQHMFHSVIRDITTHWLNEDERR